jgi:crotonobetainyl-CoA:carnitine CoA-transferase CaiB-like acyl-CoA transferase
MNENSNRRERDFVKEIDDPMYGKYVEHEFPVMMSRTPPKIKWTVRPVGFDNEYVLQKILGRSVAEIDELHKKGVVGKWKDMQGRRPPADWDGACGAIMRR